MSFLKKLASIALPIIGTAIAGPIGGAIGGGLGGAVSGGGGKAAILGALMGGAGGMMSGGSGIGALSSTALGRMNTSLMNSGLGQALGGLGHSLGGLFGGGGGVSGTADDVFSLGNVADAGVDFADDFSYGPLAAATRSAAPAGGSGLFGKIFSQGGKDTIGLMSALLPLLQDSVPQGALSQQDMQNQIADQKAQDAKINASMYSALNAPAIQRTAVQPISTEDYYTYGSKPQQIFFNEVNPKMNEAPQFKDGGRVRGYAEGGEVPWGQEDPGMAAWWDSIRRGGKGGESAYQDNEAQKQRVRSMLSNPQETGVFAAATFDPLKGEIHDPLGEFIGQLGDQEFISRNFNNDPTAYLKALAPFAKQYGMDDISGLGMKFSSLQPVISGAQAHMGAAPSGININAAPAAVPAPVEQAHASLSQLVLPNPEQYGMGPQQQIVNNTYADGGEVSEEDAQRLLAILSGLTDVEDEGPLNFDARALLAKRAMGQEAAPPADIFNDQMMQQLLQRLNNGMEDEGYAAGGKVKDRGALSGGGRDDRIGALVSPGEHIVDAQTVALLGDGNPEEGHRRLETMKKGVQKQKGVNPKKVKKKAKQPKQYMGGH